MSTSRTSAWRRLQAFRHRYERAEQLVFFAAGFLFDSVMIRRIDDTLVLIQQGAYLIVIGVMLAGLVAWNERTPAVVALKWLTTVSGPLLHFMLGTLLNAYALFYFKSASGWTAVLFVAVIAGLLLVNELPVFRRLGPVVVYALYSFCLTSYFAYLYPVLIGRLRWWMFVLAVATALAPLLLLGRVHLRVTGDRRRVFRHALLPSLGTQAALLALFLLRWLPPVPLSLMEIGIYHGVTRDASGSYQLSRQAAPWWKPWAIDDTDFTARAGDRVYCFFRVFAPVRFEDDVRVRWSYRDPGRGWLPSDAVPIAVRGGRERGFTGYAYKQNWRPGQWRVAVETADGREIGRRDFSVREDGPSQTVQRSRTRGRIAPDNCAHGSFSGGRRHERFEHPGCSRARVRVGDAFPGRRAGHGMRSRLPDEHCRFVSGRARRSRCLEGSDGREREVHGAGESPQGRRGRPLEKRDLDVDHVQDSGR